MLRWFHLIPQSLLYNIKALYWLPEHEIQWHLLAQIPSWPRWPPFWQLSAVSGKGWKMHCHMHTLHFHVWIFSIHLLVPLCKNMIISGDSSQVNLQASWPKMFVMTSSILSLRFTLPFDNWRSCAQVTGKNVWIPPLNRIHLMQSRSWPMSCLVITFRE